MTLAVIIAIVCVTMALQDTLSTGLVVAEGRNLGKWAGVLDALGDYTSRVGTALCAGAYVKWGLGDWRTQAIFLASAVTSYFATNYATGLANRILPGHRH